MLVLTRKIGEEIRIGNDVVIRVCAIQGNRVKLGIDAPRTCRVRRSEMIAQSRARPGTTVERRDSAKSAAQPESYSSAK